MHRVVDVDLAGQAKPFRMHEDAYEKLGSYRDQARARLTDPDRDEVMGDLERAIGTKLADRVGPAERILSLEDVEAVVADVGPVGTPDDRPAPVAARPPGNRRLYRIRDDQWFAGVCQGLAAYTEIRVDWVRTIFILLTLISAGLFIFVYVVLAFVLPVVESYDAWIAALDERS
jgi:phage shock protein PspC (stress-responsive transcriptional regulator)